MLTLSRFRDGLVTIVQAAGSLDANTAHELEAELNAIINDGEQLIVLDFAELEYMSSAGLMVLVSAQKTVGPKGGKIVLCGLRESLHMMYRLTGLPKLIPQVATRDDAVRELAA